MTKYRPTFITHYYRKGTPPFQSLSSLPDQQAVDLMRLLADDTPFGQRFKDPEGYLKNRRKSEAWVRLEFMLKGGKPQLDYPIYFVLGDSRWLEKNSPDRSLHQAIQIDLAAFDEGDVSFTYPDSMISYWLGRDPTSLLYLPEFHGKVFTRQEILALVDRMGDPELGWGSKLPTDLAPYIEVQVWNLAPLRGFL
jgi:hypothetical protein